MNKVKPTVIFFTLLIAATLATTGCGDGGSATGEKETTPAPVSATTPTPGLDVSLHSAKGEIIKTRTDVNGKYYVDNLPKGEYDIKFSSGEAGHITHGGGRWEGQAKSVTPAKQ